MELHAQRASGHGRCVPHLASGTHQLTAQATDKAGNAGDPSTAQAAIIGTPGDDIVPGISGPNFAAAGMGDDVYAVDNITDQVMESAGEGRDTILTSVDYTLAAGVAIEFLQANAGATGLTLTGNGFANTITGGDGNDVITGDGAADVLLGGLGADIFAFLALTDSAVIAASRDTIGDYSALAGDLIGLSGIDANTGVGGDQAFAFIGAASFSGVAGQLRAQVGGGTTVVSGDVNGDSVADFAIKLTGSHALNGANFIL